ncbi:MAG: HD domain-containing phosphohydrolase [Burkholderiales bacterium]
MKRSTDYPHLLGSVNALSEALEVRDAYTRSHCDRAVRLATEVGYACDVSDLELDRLRVGARFHDIGKIGIPDAVLLKPARLTGDEWILMMAHSALGEQIFMATALPDQDEIATVIRHHHESFDGSGYPDGLAREAIPLLSRILLIVDAYDAMTTTRPYHLERTHAQAMEIMWSESGSKFDPEIFRIFSDLIDHSPARMH